MNADVYVYVASVFYSQYEFIHRGYCVRGTPLENHALLFRARRGAGVHFTRRPASACASSRPRPRDGRASARTPRRRGKQVS